MSRNVFSIIALGSLLMVTMALAACNTVEGVGKDIEKGGEKIQEVAE